MLVDMQQSKAKQTRAREQCVCLGVPGEGGAESFTKIQYIEITMVLVVSFLSQIK